MDEATNKKRKVIINIFYYAILLGLFYFFMRYAFGIFLPFFVAVIIAVILQKPINYITGKTPLKKGLVSAILVLLLVAVVTTLVIFVGSQIMAVAKNFATFLTQKIDSLPSFINTIQQWIYEKLKFLPDSAERVVHNAIDTLVGNLSSFAASSEVSSAASSASAIGMDFSLLSGPINGIWSFAKGIPSILISVVVSIIASCFICSDYDLLKAFIIHQFKGEKRHALSRAKTIFKSSVLKLLKAYAIIIFITFVEMAVGLKIMEMMKIFESEYVIFISLITAVVDIMPVLGTGTILIPWALYSFITGDTPLGIGLLVIYAFITVARQFIEPKLVAGQLGLPPFITIIGMYVGLKLFSVIGMLIVPLMIIMLKLLNDDGVIHLWNPVPGMTADINSENSSGNADENKASSFPSLKNLFKRDKKK